MRVYKFLFVVLACFSALYLSATDSNALPSYCGVTSAQCSNLPTDCDTCHSGPANQACNSGDVCYFCPDDPSCSGTTTYTITASAGAGGSISPAGAVPVNEGNSQTFTITAYPGYEVANVLVDGSSVGAVTAYNFSNVIANHTIAASFSALPVTYTINASAGAGGSISPTGAVTVNEGASQAFTITADPGYGVADVVVDAISVGAVTAYTFSNVTANHTIAATFAPVVTYIINASAGPGGVISPSGPVEVDEGTDQTFDFIPDLGYEVADVVVDGASVGLVPSYTFANVTASHTIDVSFSLSSTPTAGFTADPASGSGGTPLAVQFTDISTANPTSWLWEFGDGLTSTEQHPLHAYYDWGTYPVTLTVANDAGSDGITQDYVVNPCINSFAVKVANDGLFDSVMAAYDTAFFLGLDTLLLKAGTIAEDLYFDTDMPVVLKGGYNCEFTDNQMMTTIGGLLTIDAGSVTVERIELQGLPKRFVDNGDGTVTDNNTGLVWLKDANCFGQMTWDNATAAAAGLAAGNCGLTDGSIAGDWRLPAEDAGASREWRDLMDSTYANPPLSNTFGLGQWSEGDAFSQVQSAPYWSSIPYSATIAWSGNFSGNGSIVPKYKTDLHYVWPVRNP